MEKILLKPAATILLNKPNSTIQNTKKIELKASQTTSNAITIKQQPQQQQLKHQQPKLQQQQQQVLQQQKVQQQQMQIQKCNNIAMAPPKVIQEIATVQNMVTEVSNIFAKREANNQKLRNHLDALDKQLAYIQKETQKQAELVGSLNAKQSFYRYQSDELSKDVNDFLNTDIVKFETECKRFQVKNSACKSLLDEIHEHIAMLKVENDAQACVIASLKHSITQYHTKSSVITTAHVYIAADVKELIANITQS